MEQHSNQFHDCGTAMTRGNFSNMQNYQLPSLKLTWHLSNETIPGYLLYIGDYTTQWYRDYNKPL